MFKNHFVLLSFRISVAHKLIYSYVICKECNMALIFVKQKQVFLLTMLENNYARENLHLCLAGFTSELFLSSWDFLLLKGSFLQFGGLNKIDVFLLKAT